MALTKLSSLKIYVSHETRRLAVKAARRHGGNLSAYVRGLIEQDIRPHRSFENRVLTNLDYLLTSTDATMDEVQLLRLPPGRIPYRDPNGDSLRAVVSRVHRARMTGTSDAD